MAMSVVPGEIGGGKGSQVYQGGGREAGGRVRGLDGMDQFCGELFSPSPDEDWVKFARSSYTSYFHGVGTCKMGPASDPMAVVDQHLRVHGMENLWIADASIMPTVAHANTNLTCMMIGERAADFVKESS